MMMEVPLSDFPRVAPSMDHQRPRFEPAPQSVGEDRRGIGERQREMLFRNTPHGLGQFISERDRKRERATVAAGPAIGIAPQPMNAGKEIRGHSDIAVP